MGVCLIGAILASTLMCVHGHHIRYSRVSQACTGNTITLDCTDISLFESRIEVTKAEYGRALGGPCGSGTPCSDPISYNNTIKMAYYCDSRSSCDVLVTDADFGSHCPGASKYLEVEYDCVEDHPPCDELPDEYNCNMCSYCSECSEECGIGIAWVTMFCLSDPNWWIPPRVCTIPCCNEPCIGNGDGPPAPNPCWNYYPNAGLECLSTFSVDDWGF